MSSKSQQVSNICIEPRNVKLIEVLFMKLYHMHLTKQLDTSMLLITAVLAGIGEIIPIRQNTFQPQN